MDTAERDAVAAKLHECLSDLRHFSEEFRVLAEGPSPRWIKIDAGHVSDHRVTGVVQDVSDRKESEQRLRALNESLENLVTARTHQLNQSLKELEAFSYSVAHDLRAPVRSIIGLSEMLLHTQPDRFEPEGTELVQRIVSTGLRMRALIEALLHMASLNQVPMQLRVVDISGIAGEIASQLMESEPQRVADVRISPKLEAMADPTLVRSLLDNLMRNAWKFCARSKITRIDVGAMTLGGETVFFVRDNGCGFDMASADRLFGPFQRLHREDEYAGTGIGLTIVQRIVMRHGGRVWAFSEPGLGAAFHFTLSA